MFLNILTTKKMYFVVGKNVILFSITITNLIYQWITYYLFIYYNILDLVAPTFNTVQIGVVHEY
jgi:hypothetical protein